jgi:hypothetical protein
MSSGHGASRFHPATIAAIANGSYPSPGMLISHVPSGVASASAVSAHRWHSSIREHAAKAFLAA